MKRVSPLAVVLGLAAVAGAGVAALFVWAGGSGTDASPREAHTERCAGLRAAAARTCYTREFLAMVEGRSDPRPAVAAIGDSARRQGGFLLSSCHGVMHTVGRTYAREAGVTLAALMDYLPRSNDPGCAAGFAHGLVTGVAPLVDSSRPREAVAVCAEAGTRYQRYSCTHGFGHAFMRISDGALAAALELCRALGVRAAPDCAQGAYHDYWFAVVGVDDATLPAEAVTDPRRLCAEQPPVFVRPCWYRAFVDNRPEGIVVDSPEHLDVLCKDLAGLQRAGCITAASVIGPPDPALQLELCAALEAESDASACVRGTKVQNLLGSPTSTYVELIGRCERFAGASRTACYRWLGKTLAVVTDGAFERAGCPELAANDARRACEAGARSMEEALVTFS
jgi:hypothetical protein